MFGVQRDGLTMELFSYQVFLGKEDSLHVYIFFFLASVLHKTNMIQSVSLDTCIFNSVIRISFYILILMCFCFCCFLGLLHEQVHSTCSHC